MLSEMLKVGVADPGERVSWHTGNKPTVLVVDS